MKACLKDELTLFPDRTNQLFRYVTYKLITVTGQDASDVTIPVTITMGRESLSICTIHQNENVTLDITVDTGEESGHNRFAVWIVQSAGRFWNELDAFYVDGSTQISVPLDTSYVVAGEEELFTVTLFHSDNFVTGASLGGHFICLTILD